MEDDMTTIRLKTDRKPALTWLLIMLAAVLTVFAFAGLSYAAAKQKTFTSPEEAVKALVEAGRNNDMKELTAILGPAGKDVLSSGDKVADKLGRERFIAAYDEKNTLTPEGDGMVLTLGKDDWPFPIPVVKKGEAWYFDTKKGKEEILNRRIGRDELDTIQTCLAIVDAQREYAMEDFNEKNLPEYAQKFISDSGKKNGLYWKTSEGEKPSPLGPLVVQAKEKGYKKEHADVPVPYNGYYYRILKAQGKHASDGAHDYMVHGRMIGGFAVVAYPATYGNSGVMTFIVNYDGVVYQKNLGKNTEKAAKAMKIYDPDTSWKKVAE
jgi:Protein of unknown function (DUF2950)